MADRDKTKDQLIAELELLRAEVATLKQIGQTHFTATPPVENWPIAPSVSLADDVEVTGQYTILLIDDSEVDRVTYRRFLREDRDRTYQIVEFDNGEEALEWCQQNLPDIFLIDYFLPDMDGLELLQQIQQQTGRNSLPVIMFTGQGNLQIAVDLLKSGAKDYLEKNQITPQILHRSIGYILRENKLIREREWQQQKQQLLAKTALAIRESLNIDDILNSTVREVRNILQCDRVIIFQFYPDWGGIVLVESVVDESKAILPLNLYDPCIGKDYVEPFKKGLITAKSDIYNSDITPCHIEFLESLQVRANLVVPITKGDELWGLLVAHHCTAPRQWQSSEIELLRQVVIQAGIALQQADLVEQLQRELREREQAQIALQENEQKLQLFIKYAPASIVMFDQQMRYIAASQRWIDDFHLNSIESILGRSHYEVFPNISEEWKHFHQRGLAGFIEKCEEDFFVNSDGTWQWLRWEIHPWYRANSEIGGIILFTEDITERKQAQITLQQLNAELEQRVRERTTELTKVNDHLLVTLLEKEHAYQLVKEQAQLLDLAHDSIITWDLNSVITFWNQGAESMYGWTKAEALGQHAHTFLKTQFPQPLGEIKAQLLEKGYWEGELIHYTWDDYPITVSSRWVVQKDDGGRVIKILQINNDITERKQAESALQEYIHQVEDLYNNAPCGYHSLDAEGIIVRINDTELNWLGYTRDELLNKKKFVEIMSPEGQQVFYQNFPLFKQQGRLDNLELKVLNKDGSIRWVNVNATAIRDEDGNFIRSRSSLFDISDRKQLENERKQAELALQKSEEQRRLALDLTHIGFWDTDLLTGKMIWNDNHFTLLGLVPGGSEPIYQLWRSRVHPEDIERVEGLYFHSLQARIDYEAEYRVVHPDGSVHWLMGRAQAIYDELGQPTRSLGVLLDITERKRTEETLRKYERVISNTTDGIALLNRDYTYQIANQAYLTWCNKSEEEVIGNSVRNILGADLFDHFIQPRLDQCLAGEIIRYEKWFDYPNLVPQFLSVTYTPLRDAGENISGVIVSLRDLTRLKRAEDSLHQSESTLRSFFNSASMMMGIVEIYPNDIFHLSSNISTTQFFGTTPDGMQNRFASEIGVPQALIEMWLDFYRETERTGTPQKFQYKHQMANIQKWLSVTTSLIEKSPIGRPRFSFIVEDITEGKQAEQTLEVQAIITRNMAEGICLVRADNRVIVYANPKFEQMFGYDCGELNNQHVSILNYENESVSAEDVTQAIVSAILQNGEATYQVHNVKKDGTQFWCSATTSIFKHPDYGDILLAVQQDITDRKHAEETLQQKSRQEKLLWGITQAIRQSLNINAILHTAVIQVRQTLQTDRAAVYRFNPDWSGDFVVESVGENWVKLVGQNIQKVWEDTYLQETKGGRFQNNESFVVNDIYRAGLQSCHIELLEQFQAKSYAILPIFAGETLWGLLTIYENAKPREWQSWEVELLEQIANQLSIAIQQSELYEKLQIELQERKQAEAIIREAERRWRSLLDNVQLIVVGLDQRGNVNYINPSFLSLTGYTKDEILGKNWFENFIPLSEQKATQAHFWQVLNQNARSYYRNPILTKSGEEKFIAWNNTMLQDSQGNIIGTISIGEDITERQKIEKIKDEFIGIVSHELRTPLTAIQMSLGLIKTGIYDKKPEKSRRMIEIALLDTNRLVNLVNDMLDLERLESGRAVLEKTVCKAADLIEQAIQGIHAIATKEQITLTFTPTDAEVWAARDPIIQTLTNLLSNAIKFSPPHSTIDVSTEIQTDFVLFQVRDRGRGIPADKLELIFARFQQVDPSDSREKGGTGLGLAICRSIIERHGGKIWAESSLGIGSTFFFTLPLPLEHLL
jgi:PAS domain S-box-containing protein